MQPLGLPPRRLAGRAEREAAARQPAAELAVTLLGKGGAGPRQSGPRQQGAATAARNLLVARAGPAGTPSPAQPGAGAAPHGAEGKMEPPWRARRAQRPAEAGAEAAALLAAPHPPPRGYLHRDGRLRAGKTLASAQRRTGLLQDGLCG